MTSTPTHVSAFEDKYTSHFADVNGLRLHYTDWNPDGDQTILMLHGLNVQLHTWDPLANELMRDHRVICLDLRGHGESDWSREGYWTEQFVSDVHGLLRAVGAVPCALVGHSLGARIAIAYAGEHPDDVTHLMLSDTGPETPASTAKDVGNFIAGTNDTRGFRSEEEALEHYREAHPEWQPIFHDLHARHQVRENWAGKLVLRSDPDMYWIMRGAGLKEVPYLWDMAGKITAPTLVMRGVTSPFFNDDILERMQAVIERVEVATFETGHYIPREDPDGFVEAIRAFLAR